MKHRYQKYHHNILYEYMYFYADLPNTLYAIDGIVYMRVIAHFRSISNINTVSQEFDGKLWMQIKWTISKEYDSVDLENEWQPMIEIMNNHGRMQQEKCVITKKHKGEGLTALYANYLFQGTFSEQFNLKQFPIDTQQLHISFTLWGCPVVTQKRRRASLVDDIDFNMRKLKMYTRIDKNAIFEEEFVPCEVWSLSSPVLIWQGQNQALQTASKVEHVTVEISFFVQRKIGFYFINILAPSFIIVASSISSRMLPTFANQQSLVYTLMLTIVSLKFATVSFIPKTSVITYLDKYSLISFIWVTIAALHNVVMYQLSFHDYNPTTVQKTDRAIIYWQLGAWVIFNSSILLLLCKKIRDLVSQHLYHINRHKRILVDTERHDKLPQQRGYVPIDINFKSTINLMDSARKMKNNDSRKNLPVVVFPDNSSTLALSSLNGMITDRKHAGYYNKEIAHSAYTWHGSVLHIEKNDTDEE